MGLCSRCYEKTRFDFLCCHKRSNGMKEINQLKVKKNSGINSEIKFSHRSWGFINHLRCTYIAIHMFKLNITGVRDMSNNHLSKGIIANK